MIRAIVFDCDGLIVDTETPGYEAFREVYKQYGVDLPLDVYVQCVGSSFDRFDPFNYLEACIQKPIDRERVEQLVRQTFLKFVSRQTLLPGVKSYLQSAKQMGLKIGLASSSNREWVEEYLNRFDITRYFDSIHTADDVKRVKPDPELYIQAIDSLGVSGEEAVAFEDSINGLKAAKGAGMHCVIVPNPVTAHLPFEQYDLKLNSMADMPLNEVIQTLGSRLPSDSSGTNTG